MTGAQRRGIPPRAISSSWRPGPRATGRCAACRRRIQGSPERDALAAAGLAWDEVAAHREGLICLSGGRMGWIERYLRRRGCEPRAGFYAARLAGIFDENAYLSLEIHGDADRRGRGGSRRTGPAHGAAPVAVQPVYCLAPDDEPKLRLLAAIRENRPLGERDRCGRAAGVRGRMALADPAEVRSDQPGSRMRSRVPGRLPQPAVTRCQTARPSGPR